MRHMLARGCPIAPHRNRTTRHRVAVNHNERIAQTCCKFRQQNSVAIPRHPRHLPHPRRPQTRPARAARPPRPARRRTRAAGGSRAARGTAPGRPPRPRWCAPPRTPPSGGQGNSVIHCVDMQTRAPPRTPPSGGRGRRGARVIRCVDMQAGARLLSNSGLQALACLEAAVRLATAGPSRRPAPYAYCVQCMHEKYSVNDPSRAAVRQKRQHLVRHAIMHKNIRHTPPCSTHRCTPHTRERTSQSSERQSPKRCASRLSRYTVWLRCSARQAKWCRSPIMSVCTCARAWGAAWGADQKYSRSQHDAPGPGRTAPGAPLAMGGAQGSQRCWRRAAALRGRRATPSRQRPDAVCAGRPAALHRLRLQGPRAPTRVRRAARRVLPYPILTLPTLTLSRRRARAPGTSGPGCARPSCAG